MERSEHIRRQLRHELSAGRFRLEYQPQVRLSDQRIVGLEALCRWSLEPLGEISPEEFIPTVESQGLLDDYRQWLLDTLWRDTPALVAQYPTLDFSLNFSLNEVVRPGWLEVMLTWLHKMPTASASRWIVEVTEHAYAGSWAPVIAALQPLRQAGVRLAVDDFGTGASDMVRLQAFPFDVIKLDKSWVQQSHTPEMQERVQALLTYAQQHQQQVVAEGVETLEQAQQVQALGIDVAQGFLFGKAQPISHWLAAPTRFA